MITVVTYLLIGLSAGVLIAWVVMIVRMEIDRSRDYRPKNEKRVKELEKKYREKYGSERRE
jgi:hypothetical protein